nr:putative reverse transcriptase domain-containing protein [Tanacetum cinerariifolium]
MPPRMRTRSADWPVAESRGGETGVRVGRGGRVEDLEKDMSGCSIDQKVKYTAGSFVGKALTWWNSQIYTLSQEVAVSMSWNNSKFMMIEEFCPSHEMQKSKNKLWNHVMVGAGHAAYTDRFHELARFGSIKKFEKRGNVGKSSKDKNGRDDNKRTRTGNAFAITANPVGRENTGVWPKCTTCNSYHAPGGPCRTCFNYNYPGHLARDCRVVPRNVNPINARNPTPALGACHEFGSTDHLKPACPKLNRAQGPGGNRTNQVAANNGEIDKVIKGCKLEIEGHVFDIDLIPFGHRSFDVIIDMDWLSNHKAEIICHEKVVRIQLLDGKFQIELIPRAVSIAKSPYRLAPSELEELLGQLKELQDKDPSKIEVVKNWKALRTPSKIRSFLGLAGYYRRFIGNFSKIAESLTILTQKSLPDRPKDFMIHYDASGLGLGGELMPRELFCDYECEIHYYLGKENVVADVLSRKEREDVDEYAGLQRGLDKMIEQKSDGTLYYLDRIWVPLKGDIKTLIMDEAHKSKYSIHPGVDKMYYDLRDRYWWSGMKKDITEYKGIAMDFVTKFPRTNSGHDTIWVIVDRLTKSAYFLPMRKDYKMDRLARLYLNEIVTRHGVLISIISDCNSHSTSRYWQSMQEALGTRLDMSTAYHPQTDGQSERTIQTLEDMLRVCNLDFEGCWDVHIPLVEFSYNNSYHSSVRCALFEIKDTLKAARDRQKSYVDKRRKPLEFSVGDYVLLKVSPWKGMVRFGKKRKLAPRFVRPFEIIKKVGPIAYRLDLPEELDGVHDTFHVSNLKKCLADPTLQVPLDEIQVDAKLNFVKEPVEILEREFKKLKRSRIAIVKVRWNSKRGPEFTREREDQRKLKYPHLFSDVSS